MINAVIDISHYTNVASFATVQQAGIVGVFQKATQGATYTDPTFSDNRQKIADAGLLFGAYHFGTAGDAGAQADHLLAVAGTDALLVLDFEPNTQGSTMSLDEAELFVHHIYTVTGHYPGLYSGSLVKQCLSSAGIASPSQTELSKCWLWIAQYSPAPLLPKVWNTWTLWQYTDGAQGPLQPHTVNGIGRCDRDQFNGTEGELRSFWSARGVNQ